MDGGEAQCAGGLDVCQRIVNEDAILRGVVDARQSVLEDGWVGFEQTDFAGDDGVVEHDKEGMNLARQRKFFGGGVGQNVEWIAPLFEPAHNCDRVFDRLTDGFQPFFIEQVEEMRVLRKLFRCLRNAFGKRESPIHARVPLEETDFFEKHVHCFWSGKALIVDVVQIPFDEHVAEIEEEGGEGRHGGYFSRGWGECVLRIAWRVEHGAMWILTVPFTDSLSI